ncbi:rhodanese-like domain-containing protein [Pseudomaricurvus sp. HS19]|nr:rhodanese-like domain-containing protein [Pseudomaricurvus sp. HS19]MYM62545.1 rhodanese-like domain-containing protein [Pseudomaricurvus sp. HS19]
MCAVASADEAPLAVTGATTITVPQARYLYERGAVFVDVRSREDWQAGHIRGALHLDFRNDFDLLQSITSIKADTPLVLYCESRHCLRSAYASLVSVLWGYQHVYYFRDGYFAWMLQDYPMTFRTVAGTLN